MSSFLILECGQGLMWIGVQGRSSFVVTLQAVIRYVWFFFVELALELHHDP